MTADTSAAQSAARPDHGLAVPDPRRWLTLAVVLAGAFMILLDATIVNVAIPPIQESLAASYGAVEWVIGGYALAYGLLLIPAGRLGDRYGRKRLLLLGFAGFTAASVLCGVATSPGALIGWRVAQGAMAGVLNTQIIAVIQIAFPPRERGKAFAAYGIVSGVATALGPLLGGLLIAWDLAGLGWRPIFLINLPIGLAALAAAIRLVPESRGRGGALDGVGIMLLGAALLLAVYPLVEGRESGWPAWAVACLTAAVPVLAGFAFWEVWRIRHGRSPLVDVRLFGNRFFAAGVGIGLFFFAGFISVLFVLSLYLQIGLGRSALAAGATLLAFALGIFLGAGVSDPLARRLGRGALQLGSLVAAAGMVGVILAIRAADADVSALALLPGLVVGGIGSGLVIAPNVDLVLAGVPARDAGAAGGVLNTAQRVGNALGIAIVGFVLFSALASGADRAAAQAAPQLRGQLTAAGMDQPAVAGAVDTFTRCFNDQLTSGDPTVTPAGCPEPAPGDPVSAVFTDAAATALRHDYTHAVQVASWYAVGSILVTFLLTFLLPKGRPEPPSW